MTCCFASFAQCRRITMSTTAIKSGLLVWWLTLLPACLTAISACSTSSDDKAPGAIPTAPTNLTFTVQSHEAKLFWTASTDDGLVIGYDIIRDGVPVKELVDATNFLDDTLEPATSYRYSIIAVDDEGNRSTPAGIELTTIEEAPLPPIINSSNHIELLRHVFDIYSGNAYFSDLATLPDWSDPTYSGLPSGDPSLREETNITCLNGGVARFVPSYSVFPPLSWEFEFDDCQDDVAVLDGQLFREYQFSNAGSGYYVISSGLSINSQSRRLWYSGSVEEGHGGFTTSRRASNVDFDVSDDLSLLELSNVSTEISFSASSAGMSGGFSVRSDTTSNASLHSEVLEEFISTLVPNDPGTFYWPYETGRLELTAADGSGLMLNADNGDPQSVTIEISSRDGDTESLIQPWSLWNENLRFEFVFGNAWLSD